MNRWLACLAALLALLGIGHGLATRPPAWLDEDPLLHPFGLDRTETGHEPPAEGEEVDQLPPPSPERPVHLPTADARELERLPGVGPVLARRILAQRDSLGGISSADDLDAVKGIGPKLLARLLPVVSFESAIADSMSDP